MDNPYTCDNCTFNPAQYRELGGRTGYCLKHDSLLQKSTVTTCRFHKRKDLPFFVCEEGRAEHAAEFAQTHGIVFYDGKRTFVRAHYSERHAWETSSFDPNLNEVSIYHRSGKKWIFLESLIGTRHPVKSLMHSSLSRRYIQQCGPEKDNYRIVLGVAHDLGRIPTLTADDFYPVASVIDAEQLSIYQKDIELFKLYCIQEYGFLMKDEELTWISDQVKGAIEASLDSFTKKMSDLGATVIRLIIRGARSRGNFFPPSSQDGY